MKLLQPFELKGKTIKNRVGVPCMVCYDWTASDGYVTDKSISHYRALAKGGAGLICTEACAIDSFGKVCNCCLGIWEDGQIDGLRKIVAAVHEEKVPILIQIQHSGLVGYGEHTPPLNYLPEGLDPFTAQNGTIIHTPAPSDYSCTFPFDGLKRQGHEMSIETLHHYQDLFVNACIRAYQAGADGVELHGCHFYMISQFLNTQVNRRTDAYGIHPELFCTEIISRIRQATSADFIIGIRLGIFEPTLDDGIRNAKALEKAGIDYLHLSYGFQLESTETVPDDYPFNPYIYGASMIKKEVHIPVFAVNGISTPALAERILTETNVDMCFVGSGHLVNYNWTLDAMANRDVGSCLYCNFCQWRAHPGKCGGRILFERNKS